MNKNLSLGNILGILILLGIIIGILTPIIAFKYRGSKTYTSPLEWLLKLPFINISKKLVEKYSFSVDEGLNVVVYVSGGIEITEGTDKKVQVKVYEYTGIPSWIMGLEKTYNIYYNKTINTLYIDVKGYLIELKLPSNIVHSITLNIKGGGVEIDTSLKNLKEFYAKISGGALKFKFSNLAKSKININISGGALDGELDYTMFKGESYLFLSVSGGVIDLDVRQPRSIKVMVEGNVSGGIASISIGGSHIGNFFKDEGYDVAEGKLHVVYRISGGVIDLGIYR